MDALTALLVAVLMMLLNGGVLGLMHRDLPAALQPAAVSWRIGTLFMLIRMLHCGLRSRVDSMLDNSDWMNLATPMIAAIMPVIGTTAFLLLCSQRITRQWELAASTDYLTGLPNRRTLAAAGESRIQAAGARRNRLAVAVIDIDHFKSINDRY